jgi:hypothetical protein
MPSPVWQRGSRPAHGRARTEPRRDLDGLKEFGGGHVHAGKAKGRTMPLYLTAFSYTPEAWARLFENPEDRR